MPCACGHKPVKKLSIRHNSQLIYDTKKLVSPQKSGLRLSREKKKSYIPASSSAGYRASICNFPSSGQALSFSDVCGDELQSAILHQEKGSLRKERSSEK